ncbi:MAG: hypothetical protein FWF91_00170 [Coriobacteriia bacterium]|nr:hypothetical protein [Coriobacteriia bacterium]
MTDEYWKKPGPGMEAGYREAPKVGLWSRFFALRAVVWIGAILIVIVLALFATAYLSGFDSLSEMIDWYLISFKR